MLVRLDEPVTIDGVACDSADVSLAVSDSVAMRIVPCAVVDGALVSFPAWAGSVVGGADHPLVAPLMEVVSSAVESAVSGAAAHAREAKGALFLPPAEVAEVEPVPEVLDDKIDAAYRAMVAAKEAFESATIAVAEAAVKPDGKVR